MTRYAYEIRRLDNGRRITSETLRLDGDDVERLAGDLIRRARVQHPQQQGPLRCSIWPWPDETAEFPDTAPVDAQHVDG